MNALPQSTLFRRIADPRRLAQWSLVIVFGVILAAPLTGLWNPRTAEQLRERENREPAAFPTLKISDKGLLPFPKKRAIREFPRKFDAWLNDHLGLRRQRLGLYNLAQTSGVLSNSFARPAVGQSDRAPVIIGREGWLFYSGDRLVEDYRCTAPFTESELARWREVLLQRHHWLAARGMKYVVVFAPNKHSIYSEYLPRAMNRVGEKARLDQLVEFLADTPVHIVDLRPALISAKSTARTYHRTDTHWNQFGAWAGYHELMHQLAKYWPTIQPWPLERYEIKTIDGPGDYLAKQVESPLPWREEIIELIPKVARRAHSEELLVPDSDKARYHRSICPDAELSNIVVIHDSFMMALAPYLNEHFQRVQYKWTNEFPTDLIEDEKPILVIQEFVQRRLMDHRPRNPIELQPR